MVSSEKSRASVAFVMGWLSVIAYCLFTASATIVCAQITAAIAGFWHEDYVATQWQIYLMYILYQALATAVVVLFPRQLPKTEIAFFLISISGCVVFFITVLSASETKQPSEVVFTEVVNVTGWNDGVSFILGVGTCMYAYIATDGASHIAEVSLSMIVRVPSSKLTGPGAPKSRQRCPKNDDAKSLYIRH